VSQCSGGDWRDKMNDEMRREAIFHPGLSFTFCNAQDDYELQIRQIDSLARAGVDLLVVAPSDSLHLTEVVSQVRALGIPVIVTDRRLGSHDYDAFVGGNNQEVGRLMAGYIAARLPEGGEVVEICGSEESSPAQERHQGLMEGLAAHPKLRLVASVDGCWLRDTAKVRMEELIHQYPDIRAVVAQNDYMAMGAKEMVSWVHKAQLEHGEQIPSHPILYIGVDAVYGANHGLDLIAQGELNASILYPTGGDVVVQKAVQMLDGERLTGIRPSVGDSILKTFIVDAQGAALLNDMDMAVLHQVELVDLLKSRESRLLRRIDAEQMLMVMLVIALVAVLLFLLLLRRHYYQRRRAALRLVHLNRQLRDMAQLQLKEIQAAPTSSGSVEPEKTQPTTSPRTALAQEQIVKIDPFIEKVYYHIEQNYHQTDFGVEYLSVLLEMSRSQLFRKVKAIAGVTPLDLIREVRFREAQKLFQQSLSPEQVAAKVGYSSATYFMKCYEEYLDTMK